MVAETWQVNGQDGPFRQRGRWEGGTMYVLIECSGCDWEHRSEAPAEADTARVALEDRLAKQQHVCSGGRDA